MKTYVPRAQSVLAEQFTEALGAEVIASQENGGQHPSGVSYPGGRYTLRGQTLRFGDWLVTSHGVTTAMPHAEFTATYEEQAVPAWHPPPPGPAPVEAPKPAKPSKKASS